MAAADPDRLRRLLAELEGHLRRQQAPIVDAWRPGLAPGEASAVTQTELGWRLPVEVEVWFEWYDGVVPARPGYRGKEFHFTGSDFQLLSLRECIDHSQRMRTLAEELERDDPVFTADERWELRWLPLAERLSGDLIFVDCGIAHDEAAPVHDYPTHDVPTYARQPVAASLADAVATWLTLFDRRLWYYDPSRGRWEYRWEEFDEDLRRSRLV